MLMEQEQETTAHKPWLDGTGGCLDHGFGACLPAFDDGRPACVCRHMAVTAGVACMAAFSWWLACSYSVGVQQQCVYDPSSRVLT